ncbi:MAG: SLBB domain-containing protein [Acidobacteriia bacterium]|nr:SLBB domain-containing protein [Terriglobia bacterium]
MKKLSNPFHLKSRVSAVLVLMMLAFPIAVLGQERTYSNRPQVTDEANFRAEQEAESLVALSADKIIAILRDEPGLLLQAKKLLVKKAYEQGRLLDPQELTDEALFRLIRQDQNICVLITREIEDRSYVRAKPGREERDEMERRQARQPMRAGTQSSEPSPAEPQPEQLRVRQNQEDSYWSQHDHELERPPSYNDQQPPTQETAPGNDSRRQVKRADVQMPAGDYLDGINDGFPSAKTGMSRVRPDELPELLSASTTDRSLAGLDRGTDRPGAGVTPSLPPSIGPWTGSMTEPPQSGGSQFPQPARVETGSHPRNPPFSRSDEREDHPVVRHRPDPYADVPSLYDLYAQYSRRTPVLERFGQDVFRNGTGNFDELPMDLPVGPEYVLGPGDGLSIELWGSVSQRLQRVVDREGRVALPEVGAVPVSGRSLGDVQRLVQSTLRTQFRDVQADVSLSRLRTVRVYVVGDVQRPGAYDVSSLSTPLNALYIAGGPTSRGSLRILRHYRGKQLIKQIDVYDLLLHGIRSGVEGLQPGDTILVPPLGPEITIEGMVRRPAIYELLGENDLAEVLELAGGVLQSGTLRHVDVERVEAHLSRTMLRLDIPQDNNQESVTTALENFKVQDGDKIKISPILPYADKTVYLDGHVFRPGKFAYREGMKVTDLIKSYNDLLPEPYKRHAEIIRLNPPDYTPAVLAFNLEDALAGKDQDLVLKPFDTVRIFGRFDFEDPPVITVTGEVRDPGDHVSNGATYLRDAVYLAGGTTPDALLTDVQVFRKAADGKLEVLSVNLTRALAGDAKDNILLVPKDRIFIHKNLAKVDPPAVIIQGQVARPGKYPLGENMSAADLVRLAGGLKRGAYTETADLTRYLVENGQKVLGEHLAIPIAAALASQPDTDVRLHDGDVLTIGELAGWNDVGATIVVKGEVLHPGTYGIQEGERLSSIIARAGGLRSDAYPYGAIFERVQVRELEEKNRAELIRQVQDEGASLKLVASVDQDDKLAKEASLLQWKTTMERLQSTPPVGRLVIHISPDMKHWANTSADIQVRAGDVIYIPKKPNFVMVDGSVYNATAVTFKPGKSAGWYLNQAGGPTNMANKKAIFVIRADGSVVGGSGGMFSGGVLDAALQPGDMVVVPEKAFSGSSRWKNSLQVAQLVSAVGIAVQVARGF